MNVHGVRERSLREESNARALTIIDQTRLPGSLTHLRLDSLDAVATAIREMYVRGAPLIGVTAAYGLALGLRDDPSDTGLVGAVETLLATRPTAVNLRWALERIREEVAGLLPPARFDAAWEAAGRIAEADVRMCEAIGVHGAATLRKLLPSRDGKPMNIMTHCNAGWLATVDWGTALAPIYHLHDSGTPVHVWVSETRPRNQGLLTAWELGSHGVPFTLVVDNAAGFLIQTGRVDACIVGADRITSNGDVCNKVGTVLKALAAKDRGIPFLVAAPSSTIDWSIGDPGLIPIEERSAREICGDGSLSVCNPGFDITPARLVSAIVMERGTAVAKKETLAAMFPEMRSVGN